MTVPELQGRIRFAINGLAKRNAHHDFERICFEVSRKRIDSCLVLCQGRLAMAVMVVAHFDALALFRY